MFSESLLTYKDFGQIAVPFLLFLILFYIPRIELCTKFVTTKGLLMMKLLKFYFYLFFPFDNPVVP